MYICPSNQHLARRASRLAFLAVGAVLDPGLAVWLWAPLAAIDEIGDWFDLIRLLRAGVNDFRVAD